jgi:hypothetical protein
MARPATFRCVTRDVEELTFLFTLGTFLWQHGCSEDKPTFATFPICLIALWTDISSEPFVCGVPAMGAFIFFAFILQGSSYLFPLF